MLQFDFEESLGYWICSTSHAFRRALNAELEKEGITFRQWEVLAWIALQGELSQVELAECSGDRSPDAGGDSRPDGAGRLARPVQLPERPPQEANSCHRQGRSRLGADGRLRPPRPGAGPRGAVAGRARPTAFHLRADPGQSRRTRPWPPRFRLRRPTAGSRQPPSPKSSSVYQTKRPTMPAIEPIVRVLGVHKYFTPRQRAGRRAAGL